MCYRSWWSVAGMILMLAGWSDLAQAAEGEAAEQVLQDAFDGKTSLDWKILRADPSHASLTQRPGFLTLTTQFGSIHRGPRRVGDRDVDPAKVETARGEINYLECRVKDVDEFLTL